MLTVVIIIILVHQFHWCNLTSPELCTAIIVVVVIAVVNIIIVVVVIVVLAL